MKFVSGSLILRRTESALPDGAHDLAGAACAAGKPTGLAPTGVGRMADNAIMKNERTIASMRLDAIDNGCIMLEWGLI